MNLIIAKGVNTLGNFKTSAANWWHEFSKAKMGVVGLVIFVILLLMVLLAPVLATHDPYAFSPDMLVGPSFQHLLGTDVRGVDLWSAILYAGRTSLFIGLFTASIVVIVATVVGMIAGYLGGFVDDLLMRFADILTVLPRMPLLIILASMLNPNIWTIIFVIALLGWTRPARQIRALTLSLKQSDYVESTKASGGSSLHIIFHHILPNVVGIVVAHLVTEIVMVILLESGLSFLGLGDPIRLTWGQILFWAQRYAAFSGGQWWWWLPTGAAITMVCFSLAFIGTTLNDRFVLKLKWRGKD